MNKQNNEVILREIKKFYEVVCYICDLRKIESNLDIDIFQFDYKALITEEVRFLTKLKEDFFYDDIICKKITNCLNNKDNISEFVMCSVDLYNEFYGFDDQSMSKVDLKKIEEEALKAFYAKCFWEILFDDQYVKERAALYLKKNYLVRSNNKEYIDKVIKYIKINRNNLGVIDMLGIQNEESQNRINSKELIKLAEVYNEKEVDVIDETTILNLLDIYRDLYEQIGTCNITCETIGENNKEDVDYFVKNFKLDRVSEDDQINYTIDNFKIHRYI